MNRARHTFWALVVVATAAMGSLSTALTAPPSPITGMRVALGATTLALALVLAGRIHARLNPIDEEEKR